MTMEKWYAFIGSLQLYKTIIKECLRLEKEGPAPLRRHRQEIEFLPAVEEVMDAPASPLGRGILLAVAGFFVIAVIWSIVGKVDIIATTQGRIIPSDNVKVIQPFETGVVHAIHVRDGQRVEQDQVLVELDPTEADADVTRVARELVTAQMTAARLEALLSNNPMAAFSPPEGVPQDLVKHNLRHLETAVVERIARNATLLNDINQRRAEIRTTEVEIMRVEKILPKMLERLNMSQALLDKNFTPRLDHLRLEEERVGLDTQLASAQSRMEELKASLGAITSRSDQLLAEERRTTLDQLADANTRADGLKQELIKARDRSSRLTMRAPVSGVVQQLAIHTQGGVVTPAQELMIVVPAEGGIVIEAMLNNIDKGHVHKGQEVEIKIDSFPFTKFGTLNGTVETVSRYSVLDEKLGWVYPASFNLFETEILVGNKYVQLSPGMTVTAEIKTGKRRMIAYLLAPLQEYQSESLKER